jgi:hypothetical protein
LRVESTAFAHLMGYVNGIIGNWHEADVIRISPAPLYNQLEDCIVFAEAVQEWGLRLLPMQPERCRHDSPREP